MTVDDAADEESPVVPAASTAGRTVAFVVMPLILFSITAGAGYLNWQANSARNMELARSSSVRAATDCAVAMLSYRPDTVGNDLTAVTARMTGDFRDSYTKLLRDVVIPGAKEKQISATATVTDAAPISTTDSNAQVLLFVKQSITVGDSSPSETTSSVRMALDNVDNHWLVSKFEPLPQ